MKGLTEYKVGFVVSCYVEYYESGVVSVLFDVRKRWLPYSRGSDLTYSFEDEDGNDIHISLTEEQLKLPELPEDEFYMHYHNQEKDQIEYIYVPSKLLGV